MAVAKLEDAELLLRSGRFASAYYLAGYTVEFGLKACIAAQISPETIPDKDLLRNVLKHEFTALIGLAGLRADLKNEQDRDSDFAANWALASEWSPDSRYEPCDSMSAQLLVEAIGNPRSGVLKWIRARW